MFNYLQHCISLPRIESMNDLSDMTYLSEATLYKISYNTDRFYSEVCVLKRSGGQRILACPSPTLKAVQAWILRNILDKIPAEHHATAFQPGCRIADNAERHKGNTFFLCLDLRDFFGSIKRKKIYMFFRSLGYAKHPALILTNFCTYKNSLPQGGVTSPALSNLVSIRLDRRLASYTGLRNITYTRYADDITLSCNNPDKLWSAFKMVSKIIADEGYTLNASKTRLLRPGMSRKVVGMTFSDNGKIGIGRKQLRLLRAKIHKLTTKPLTPDERKRLYYHVCGWLAFVKSVDPSSYKKLFAYWEQLQSTLQAAPTSQF